MRGSPRSHNDCWGAPPLAILATIIAALSVAPGGVAFWGGSSTTGCRMIVPVQRLVSSGGSVILPHPTVSNPCGRRSLAGVDSTDTAPDGPSPSSPRSSSSPSPRCVQQSSIIFHSPNPLSRRGFFSTPQPFAATALVATAVAAAAAAVPEPSYATPSAPAIASTPISTTTATIKQNDESDLQQEALHAAFAAVRAEATSPQGGVAYLRDQLSNRDFPAVLEFTKTYDGVLRKRLLGRAKKQLELSSNEFVSNPQQQKELLVLATNIANAVTFDLIGMNRSSRPGQESAEQAAKYLQELQDDLQRFLDLEPQ